ncbi:polysaccharide deacetylase family protein [Clostridiales bacterium FE2011]|nr:polysaccharide deacetylase family protein [Clostridiales bacterium FE2011]
MFDIPILMFHSVNDTPQLSPMGELSVSAAGFEQYLKLFKKWNYQMISMSDLINHNYSDDRNFVVLTFDDGFKDNLTVALPILKRYEARATIFVNPNYTSEKTDEKSDWGFMTWEEILEAEESGVFDIQAHTMTHEFAFISDEIIDFYTPNKFNKFYWLAWMLFPESPSKWNSEAYKYKDMIPIGYPIFKYGRRIAQKKFNPDPDYVKHLIKGFQQNGYVTDQYAGKHGEYENISDYEKYIVWEIVECKRVLEEKLNKEISTLCFPGGGYTEAALDISKKCGYKCYMIASRLREGNNFQHLENIRKGQFDGFNRTAFSLIHPGFLPEAFFDKWVAKLSLGAYQKMPRYMILKKLLSKVWHA